MYVSIIGFVGVVFGERERTERLPDMDHRTRLPHFSLLFFSVCHFLLLGGSQFQKLKSAMQYSKYQNRSVYRFKHNFLSEIHYPLSLVKLIFPSSMKKKDKQRARAAKFHS